MATQVSVQIQLLFLPVTEGGDLVWRPPKLIRHWAWQTSCLVEIFSLHGTEDAITTTTVVQHHYRGVGVECKDTPSILGLRESLEPTFMSPSVTYAVLKYYAMILSNSGHANILTASCTSYCQLFVKGDGFLTCIWTSPWSESTCRSIQEVSQSINRQSVFPDLLQLLCTIGMWEGLISRINLSRHPLKNN